MHQLLQGDKVNSVVDCVFQENQGKQVVQFPSLIHEPTHKWQTGSLLIAFLGFLVFLTTFHFFIQYSHALIEYMLSCWTFFCNITVSKIGKKN